MKIVKTTYNRRSFLKASVLSGGGMLLSMDWLSNFKLAEMPEMGNLNVQELNGFVKINADNTIIIMSPNPEGGQNVKTSMPMIVV